VSRPVSCLSPVQLQRDLGMRDLSEPAEGPHRQGRGEALSRMELRGSLVPRSPGRAGRRQLRPAAGQ